MSAVTNCTKKTKHHFDAVDGSIVWGGGFRGCINLDEAPMSMMFLSDCSGDYAKKRQRFEWINLRRRRRGKVLGRLDLLMWSRVKIGYFPEVRRQSRWDGKACSNCNSRTETNLCYVCLFCFFFIVDFKASINPTDTRVLGQCLSSPLNNEATRDDVNMTYLS